MSGLDYFGKEHCHFDYGSGSSETSTSIQDLAYNKPDFYALETRLRNLDIKLLSGHVHMRRYSGLFPLNNIVTFLRNPLDQFISHFEHKTRHHGYKGSIEEMMNTPSGPDIQAHCLFSCPLEAYGFIGVTERYEESLRVFNSYYKTDFKFASLNTNPQKKQSSYSLPDNLIESFNKKSKASADLYYQANQLLDEHLKALNEGYDFIHGGVLSFNRSQVDGFAFDAKKNRPVRVELSINGTVQQTSAANQDRPTLRALNAPRNGYVGFNFRIKSPLKKGDHLCIQVAATDQVLFRHTVP